MISGRKKPHVQCAWLVNHSNRKFRRDENDHEVVVWAFAVQCITVANELSKVLLWYTIVICLENMINLV